MPDEYQPLDDIAVIQTERGYSLPVTLQPERFRASLLASPLATRIRWWKARLDTAFVDEYGETDAENEKGKWAWDEQVVGNYRVAIEASRSGRKYSQPGDMRTGSIQVTYMPDEIPLGDHDLIMPIGRVDNYLPDARHDGYKESLVRGEVLTPVTGTVSSSGTAVTGTGTDFVTELHEGSVIMAGGQKRKVDTITDATHLTLSAATSPNWNTNRVSLCRERLKRPNVARIESVVRGTTVYVEGPDYRLGVDNQTLEWYGNQPAPGERFSIHYYILPQYIIQFDLGSNQHVVNTKIPVQTVTARLYTPPGINR